MQGLTLIETMVAITISLILLSGAITLFINNKVTYETNENLSRLQENARFAIEFLIEDLRMTGFFGCRTVTLVENPTGVFQLDDHANGVVMGAQGDGELEDIVFPLEGIDDAPVALDATWSPSGNDDTTATIVPGTDAVTIRHLSGTHEVLTDGVSPGAIGTLTVDDGSNFSAGDVVGVSDCGGGDVFAITNVAGNDITHPALSRGYASNGDPDDPANPTLAALVAVRYFIGSDADGNPALFREEIDPTVTPRQPVQQTLIEGVESMQILYGVDNTGDNVPDTYVPANDPALTTTAQWSNVVVVKLSLLVRTNRPYGDADDVGDIVYELNDATFSVPGDVTDAPDDDTARRYKRRVFNTTVVLRNRLT